MPRPVYAEVYASVRFWGAALDPLDVTIALRLPPDHTHREGEPRLAWTKSGSLEESSPYPHGMWAMSTRGRVRSSQLSTHVAWLLSLLEPKVAELRELLAGGVEVDVLCYSRGASSRPPSLPWSLRERKHSGYRSPWTTTTTGDCGGQGGLCDRASRGARATSPGCP